MQRLLERMQRLNRLVQHIVDIGKIHPCIATLRRNKGLQLRKPQRTLEIMQMNQRVEPWFKLVWRQAEISMRVVVIGIHRGAVIETGFA
jgi:hypothetical protein